MRRSPKPLTGVRSPLPLLEKRSAKKPENAAFLALFFLKLFDFFRLHAGIVNICYCLNFPELPLKSNYDETKYKLYFFDTGIFVAMLDEEAQEDLRANKNLGVYKGAQNKGLSFTGGSESNKWNGEIA